MSKSTRMLNFYTDCLFLLILAVILQSGAGRGNRGSEYMEIVQAEVSFTGSEIVVSNFSGSAWERVDIVLNPGDSCELLRTETSFSAGSTRMIGLALFQPGGSGECRALAVQPERVLLKCDIPDGIQAEYFCRVRKLGG
ncbi:MAG: hypothetical protein PHQ23_08865 [Candidatus Wallbacteria bacterium]|nr:hypothetical protein [Candidatus Wallbacteria bacterium]